MNVKNIKIKEFYTGLINPNDSNMFDKDQGGSKITVIGKPGCFAKGTKILKYDGSIVNVEDIKKGDQVMGNDSTPRTVLDLCYGREKMYNINIKESSIIVNENHILSLKDSNNVVLNISVKEFLKMPINFKNNYKWYRTGVIFEYKDIDIDPYKLGYWISKNTNFTNSKILLELGYNHHIPLDYKINSSKVRLQLLAGLIDGNGFYDKCSKGYIQRSSSLIDDILFISRSLGFNAKEIRKNCLITGDIHEIPCKIHCVDGIENNNVLTMSFELQELEEDNYYGFTLDGNHLFLLGDFSVVHNTGKTTLINRILFEKKHIIPVAMVMSGTEKVSPNYSKIIPPLFIYNDLNIDRLDSGGIKRQVLAKQYLKNPWSCIINDDCSDDPKIFNTKLFHNLYKNGRHYKELYINSLQYPMDVKPVIRTNIDGTFIGRENIEKNRKVLYENYASIIPTYDLFCQLMDDITENHGWLYIHNAGTSNQFEDCVYYWNPEHVPSGFNRFGCDEYWEFSDNRYNQSFVQTL